MISPDYIPTSDIIADCPPSVCLLPRFASAENKWVSWHNFYFFFFSVFIFNIYRHARPWEDVTICDVTCHSIYISRFPP